MRRLRDWLSSVAPDNIGGRRATEHLLGLGHRRIAFLGGRAGMLVHEDRRAGWAKALEAAGLAADPALAVEATPNRDGGVDALQRRAGAARPADGGLVLQRRGRDRRHLRPGGERGLAAGRDFAVVGFDDIARRPPDPPRLTTVAGRKPPPRRAAAAILLEQLGPGKAAHRSPATAKLVVRAWRPASNRKPPDMTENLGWGLIGASTIGKEHMIGAIRAQGGEAWW